MSDETSTAVAVRETQEVATLVAADPLVATQEQYGLVLTAVKAVKARMKRITDHYSPLKTKAHASWKAICNQESEDLRPCQDAEKAGKRWLDTADDERERKAREEQARLRREQEERERKAREEAEAKTREAEHLAAAAEEAERRAASSRSRTAEKAKLEAEAAAQAAEKARLEAEVKAREAERVAAVPVAVVEVPKEEGTARREIWGAYEIEDETLIPREWLIPDHDKLVRYAKAMRGDAKVPGVRFYSTKQRAVSR